MTRWPDGTPRIPRERCSDCGYAFDSASEALRSKAAPKRGDISVCLNCGHATLFDVNMRHREITPGEWAEIGQDPELVSILVRAKAYCSRAMGKDLSKR